MRSAEQKQRKPPGPPGTDGDSGLDRLMQRLNTLRECEQAAAELVWCGAKAVPSLERFLFEGKPSVIYQPRQAAVQALAALGAKDVLIRYLTWKPKIDDAVTRFAEESVRNAAARALADFRTKDVLDVLLGFDLLPGVVDALGQFHCPEAIPYFVRALEDDLCRSPAMNALRNLGRDAESGLVSAALTRLPSAEEERPSSVCRRAKALELLAEIGPAPSSWRFLRPLLDEDDPEIVCGAAKLAITLGDCGDKKYTVRRLLTVLPKAGWYLREEIRGFLMDLYAEAGLLIDQECEQRNQRPEAERALDMTLRLLEGVRRSARRALPGGQGR
jgi:HEAT repeat protein